MSIYDRLLNTFTKICEAPNDEVTNWIKDSDTMLMNDLDFPFDNLFDIYYKIISIIPTELSNDNDVKTFCNNLQILMNDILNHISQNNLFLTIDINEKFIWIALMLATRTTYKIIPSLISLIPNNKKDYIIELEDNVGCNCFISACYHNFFALIQLINIYSITYLTKPCSLNITPFDLLIYNGEIIKFINNNLITIDDLLNYKNAYYNITTLHISSVSDNPTVLEYLLKNHNITLNDLMQRDSENNYALLSACSTSSLKAIELLLKSKIYKIEELIENPQDLTNLLKYVKNKEIFKIFLNNNYINDNLFFNSIIQELIQNDDDLLIELINSSLFTFDMVSSHNLSLLNSIIKKEKIFKYIIDNKNNPNIKNVLENIFQKTSSLLPMAHIHNIRTAIIIIKSEYFRPEMINDKYNNYSILEKIICDIDSNKMEKSNDTLELIDSILDKITDANMVDVEFLNYCIKNYPETIEKIISKKLYNNSNEIIEQLIYVNRYDSIYDLLNAGIIDYEILKADSFILKHLIISDEKIFDYLLDKNYGPYCINFFIKNNILNWKNVLTYKIKKSILTKLLSPDLIPTNILNNYDAIDSSILKNLEDYEELDTIIKTRSDFDQTLLFRKETGGYDLFIKNCNLGNYEFVNFLLNHELCTETYFNLLCSAPLKIRNSIFNVSKLSVVELILNNKFMSKNLVDSKFQNKNNLLQYLIVQKFPENIISNLINNNFVDTEILKYINRDGNNCLLLALENNFNYMHIINSKFFVPDIFITINKDNKSVFDYLYFVSGKNLILSYLKYFPDVDILKYKYVYGSTLVHKLLCEGHYKDVIDFVKLFGLSILLVPNDSKETALYYITLYANSNTLNYCLTHNEMSHDLLYQHDKKNIYPIANILLRNDIILLDLLLEKKLFVQEDFSIISKKPYKSKKLGKVNAEFELINTMSLIEYVICTYDPNLLFECLEKHNIDINRMLSLLNVHKHPLYVTLLKISCDIHKRNTNQYNYNYLKYVTYEMLEYKNNNYVLILDLIQKNCDFLLILINNKLIDEKLLSKYINKIILYEQNIVEFFILNIPNLFNDSSLVEYITELIYFNSPNVELLLKYQAYNTSVTNYFRENNNILSKIISLPLGLNFLLKHNILTKEIIINNNVIFSVTNSEQLKEIIKILGFENILNTNIENTKYNGKTIYHKFAEFDNIISYIIEENNKKNIFSYEILSSFDNNNKIFLDYLIENQYLDDFAMVLKTHDSETISKVSMIQDLNNKNIIIKFIESEKFRNIVSELYFDINILNKKILEQIDNNKMTTLAYITKFLPKMLDKIDFEPIIDLINIRNIDNENLLMVASRYNSNSLKILFNKLINLNILNNYNWEECFVIACKFNSQSVKIIIQESKISNYDYCFGQLLYEDTIFLGNYFQIACRYNSDSVKVLLDSKLDLSRVIEYIYNDTRVSFNALKLAIIYEPQALEYILTSKYMSDELMEKTNNIMENSCLFEAINKQVASYLKLISSPYGKNYEFHPTEGLAKNKFYDTMNKYDYDDPLLKQKNISCSIDNPNVCTICFGYEKRLIFSPCRHKTCVMCGIKVSSCPLCRKVIDCKIIYD